MNPAAESALISAAATTAGVLATAAVVSVVLRISRSASRRAASHGGGNVTGVLRRSRLRMARDAAWGCLLTFGAGRFAASSLIFTALKFNLLRGNPGPAGQRRRIYGLAGQPEVADRYTKAIRQLDSDQLDVRVRGIYALGRCTLGCGGDRPTTAEVLTAFIREHSRERWPVPESGDAPAPERTTRPDVQAALTVIARWDTTDRRGRIDLTLANLAGANLISADLADANLTGADLTRANLTRANLAGADLASVDLGRANLIGANLARAKITGANLAGAYLGAARLNGADLRRADLTAADLRFARLTGANLTRADLTGANLTRADLTGANLSSAQWPKGSPAPAGWVCDPGSGQLARASVAAGDSGH
jgi:hypothetical protein